MRTGTPRGHPHRINMPCTSTASHLWGALATRDCMAPAAAAEAMRSRVPCARAYSGLSCDFPTAARACSVAIWLTNGEVAIRAAESGCA